MNFEELQKTWQAQPAGARVTIASEMLLREVRRNARNFKITIFWRDVREVGIAALLTIFFAWHGWHHRQWTEGVLALACSGIAAFMLVDRGRQRRQRPVATDPLKACVVNSLQEVTHQIQLLRTVLWWYLLPIDLAVAIDVLVPLAPAWHNGWDVLIDTGFVLGICALTSWFLYWINQYAVRKELEPRRRELAALLAGLEGNPPPDAKP